MNKQYIIDSDGIDQTNTGEGDSQTPHIQDTRIDEIVVPTSIIDGTIVPETSGSQPISYAFPTGNSNPKQSMVDIDMGSSAALSSHEESDGLRMRWNEIQGNFVDEPRSAVQQADLLVSDVIEKITNEHNALKVLWTQDKDVSTEDLRKALQSYRSFFNRLVF